jgi:hypothetical protein
VVQSDNSCKLAAAAAPERSDSCNSLVKNMLIEKVCAGPHSHLIKGPVCACSCFCISGSAPKGNKLRQAGDIINFEQRQSPLSVRSVQDKEWCTQPVAPLDEIAEPVCALHRRPCVFRGQFFHAIWTKTTRHQEGLQYVWHLSPQQWKFVNYSCDMHPESGGGGVKLMRTPSCINTMGLKEEVVMDDVWSSCR